MFTHLVFSFFSHGVYGAGNSVHSPESRHTKDLMFTCIGSINGYLPVA